MLRRRSLLLTLVLAAVAVAPGCFGLIQRAETKGLDFSALACDPEDSGPYRALVTPSKVEYGPGEAVFVTLSLHNPTEHEIHFREHERSVAIYRINGDNLVRIGGSSASWLAEDTRQPLGPMGVRPYLTDLQVTGDGPLSQVPELSSGAYIFHVESHIAIRSTEVDRGYYACGYGAFSITA